MSSHSTPTLRDFRFLWPAERSAANEDELFAALFDAQAGFENHELRHPYCDAYAALIQDLLSELAERGVQGQVYLLRLLEAPDLPLVWDVARVAWRLFPEATLNGLRALAASDHRKALNAKYAVDTFDSTGTFASAFANVINAGKHSRLPLLASLRPFGATPEEDRRHTLAFYGMETNGPPIYQRLDELIEAMDLGRLREGIQRILLPSIGIAYEKRGAESIEGLSRFGGRPDLPEAFEWPCCQGRPLAFIGQLRLSDLATFPAISGLPRHGMIYFFYDAELQPWSEDDEPGAWQVRFHPRESGLLPCGDDCLGQPVFKNRLARFVSCVTLPVADDNAWDELGEEPTAEEWELLLLLGEELRRLQPVGGRDAVGQLLGYGTFIQGGNPNDGPRDSEPTRLLLQLGSDVETGMTWGDSGNIYFWLRQGDLDGWNLERVWGHLESY